MWFVLWVDSTHTHLPPRSLCNTTISELMNISWLWPGSLIAWLLNILSCSSFIDIWDSPPRLGATWGQAWRIPTTSQSSQGPVCSEGTQETWNTFLCHCLFLLPASHWEFTMFCYSSPVFCQGKESKCLSLPASCAWNQKLCLHSRDPVSRPCRALLGSLNLEPVAASLTSPCINITAQ